MASTPPQSNRLNQAGHALRQVLLRLNHYATEQAKRVDLATRHGKAMQAHLHDLQALLTAVEDYEEAALASLPPVPVDVLSLTPDELLAYREADPRYRLGFVRGYKRGAGPGQQAREQAISLYAKHAALPVPTDSSALIKRVRLLLDFHQDRAPLSAARLDTLQQQLAAVAIDHSTTSLYGTY